MSNPQFPVRPEGPHVLPDGTKVWIRTLNETFKQYADDAASLAARIASAPFRKGGNAYPSILNEYKAKSVEEQCSFIAMANMSIGRFDNKAEELHPDPVKPERTKDEDENKFMARMDKYEKEVEKVRDKREEECKRLYDQTIEEVKASSSKVRLEMCMDATVLDVFWKNYHTEYTKYCIYYATRDYDDHDEFYFGDDVSKAIRTITDLDDGVRNELAKRYNEIDSVRAKEIPT